MALRIIVSRHSVFYSPLIGAIAGGFLERHGLSADYGILQKGQRSTDLIREGAADIIQSAVSSNWKLMEKSETPLPVHFAQINQRDGFFLLARRPDSIFAWKNLEDAAIVADHGWQPLTMLRYAARTNGVDWSRVRLIDAGAPEAIERAYRGGEGDYIHLQAPAAHQIESEQLGRIVVSVGASMPPVAFSSLCCSREFLATDKCRAFVAAFRQAREWVRTAAPEDVAGAEAKFFPGVAPSILTTAIRAYQKLGNWAGLIEIPRDLYEQALTVFEGEIQSRHPYEQVCAAPSATVA